MSPGWTGCGPSMSTSTSASGPSERMMTFFLKSPSSSGSMPCRRAISQTHEWSKVSCSTIPSRMR